MPESTWRIYLGEIPHNRVGSYWVSFESDPGLKKTKSNIYGRCLPCIHNLYEQLKEGRTEISLGSAFNCWKIAAVMENLDECLDLLAEFEKNFPGGHVYGKFGSGREEAKTTVVVFHAENEAEKDRLHEALHQCLEAFGGDRKLQVSRGCAVLYHDILGEGEGWQPVTPIRHPENSDRLLARVKDILYRSAM